MVDRYFRGQGKIFLATRATDGTPEGFRYMGNCPELLISTDVQVLEHEESYTGQGLTDLQIETTIRAMARIRAENLNKENLAFALYGTANLITGSTVTDEAHVAYKGKSIALNFINLTAFTSLTNDAGSTTYVKGTDYEIDLKAGMIDILSGGAIADASDVKANYTAGNSEKITAFTSDNREYWLRFNGLNTAEGNKPVVIDCYKTRFKPQDQLALISNDLSSIDIEGNILYDPLQPSDKTEGFFFKIRQAQLQN